MRTALSKQRWRRPRWLFAWVRVKAMCGESSGGPRLVAQRDARGFALKALARPQFLPRTTCSSHIPPLASVTPQSHLSIMNYPYAVPDDLFDYLLWPSDSAIGEPTAVWTWTQQEGRADEEITFEELEALTGWEKNPPMPSIENICQDHSVHSTSDMRLRAYDHHRVLTGPRSQSGQILPPESHWRRQHWHGRQRLSPISPTERVHPRRVHSLT